MTRKHNCSSKWKIDRNSKEEETYYLDLLKNHFGDVTTYEKHPDAMLNILFTQIHDKILGPDYQKERVSKRKEKKIREELLKRLKNKYGRWINLVNFKFKTPDNVVYSTNFNRVYNVKNSGILYGCPSKNICGNIFFTSHCLERFEERGEPLSYTHVIDGLKKAYKVEPTSADILVTLVGTSNMEYALKDEYCYLNISVGVLVLENLDDIFIAKTFITPDMIKDWQWYLPLVDEETKFESFAELLEKESIKITKPKFYEEELAELFLNLILSEEE